MRKKTINTNKQTDIQPKEQTVKQTMKETRIAVSQSVGRSHTMTRSNNQSVQGGFRAAGAGKKETIKDQMTNWPKVKSSIYSKLQELFKLQYCIFYVLCQS